MSYDPIIKNTAYQTFISLRDSAGYKANPTIAAGDFKVSKDGGAFSNLTTLPSIAPAAGVMVQIDFSADEMNADNVALVCIDQTNPKEWADFVMVIQTAAGDTLTAIAALNDLSSADVTAAVPTVLQIQSGLATAAAVADVPTVAEFEARTLVAANYFDPAADVVAHVTLVDTTTTNTDMRGTDGSALASAYTSTRAGYLDELAAANLPADIADLPTNAELATALTDMALDSTVMKAASYTAPNNAGITAIETIADKLDTALELDGAVYRYTTNALELAPTGGSAPTAEQIRTEMDTNSTKLASILEDTGTTLDALIKDVPTVAEFEARTLPAATYFDPAADVVAHVTLVDTTTTNTDMYTARDLIRTATAQAGAAQTITLDSSASAVDGFYCGQTIVIFSGTGAGQSRSIMAYVGSSKVATVTNAWATNPANDSVFGIYAAGCPVGILARGIATAGAAASITFQTGQTWATSLLIGATVRVVAGTGAGQVRSITASTNANPTVATVDRNWTTTPDNTSVYEISESTDAMLNAGDVGSNTIAAAKIASAALSNAKFAADVGSTAYATNIIALAVDKALQNYGGSKPETAQTITPPADMALDSTVMKAASYVAPDNASITAILEDTGTTLDALIKDIPTNAELATALTDMALNSTVAKDATVMKAADYTAPDNTGIGNIETIADKLDTALEADGAVYRYTANALELAPTEGSAPTVEQIRAEIDSNSTQLAAILTDTGTTLPAQISGLNDLSAADVTGAVPTAIQIQSGLATSAEIAALNDISASDVSDAITAAEPVKANIKQVNDVTITGTGTVGSDEWRKA